MGEITLLLRRCEAGESNALDAVFERVYPELRRLAQSQLSRGQHQLTATSLVHELYLRLHGSESLSLSGQRHFYACAAKAMRRILVDDYRRGSADKRGGEFAAVELKTDLASETQARTLLLDIDQLLTRLSEISERQREIVDLHFFAGLGFAEIAALLDCAERTVMREWARARAFLHAQLDSGESRA
ncbi:MAG: sigma-70 family RNA polymerase sigma factor [Rhodanobacteraceae bacterium]|nr:sigma-70 family RNA polymerase sigma factor [Xanthomonadales bacterium]MCP5477261.1 sigma-70 family RNA polymerase sigma factor [Rhodanobacteraceae bacterium]HPF73999.1 ECF-type sigma factor [Xanthomonadaceae bacterium]HRY00375.1 ECF-type sigma factor [Xanthomonadaceae bacterium]